MNRGPDAEPVVNRAGFASRSRDSMGREFKMNVSTSISIPDKGLHTSSS